MPDRTRTPAAAIEPTDEPALIAALRAGRPAAYEQLVREHGGRMLAVAVRIMGREDDARDAVQDAFLSVLKAVGRFDGSAKLSTWLHRIVVNCCLMRLRSRRRHPETPLDTLLPRFDSSGHRENPGPAWNPPPEAGIERERVRRTVRELIDRLPDAYREVLVLRDLEELDTDETAQTLGLTAAAVKTRLHRARQALRTLLEPHMLAESEGHAAVPRPSGSGGGGP